MKDIEIIIERSDSAVQRIIDVQKTGRKSPKTFLIEDEEPILQALGAGIDFLEIYGRQGVPIRPEILALSKERDVRVRLLSTELVNQVFRVEKKPKVFALARIPKPAKLSDLADVTGDLVILDGVQIVGNIGAIVRSAYALGAGAVVLLRSGLETVSERRLVRASRGYVFSLPVIISQDQALVDYLKVTGTKAVSLDIGGELKIDDLGALNERLALIFGSEKTGASKETWAGQVSAVQIPMRPGAESLNVSVAAGITLQARQAFNLS